MRNRRIIAYAIDVVLFLLLSVLMLFVLRGINNNFLRPLVGVLGLLVTYGVVFGLISTYLRGSIGKKIMDLKVMPTIGMMTPVRLLLRDAVSKFIVFLPFMLGFALYINNRFPIPGKPIDTNASGLVTGLILTLVFAAMLAGANAYMYIKEKQLLVDVLFHTKVENDIPTATEYQDLSAFLERENEA